MKKILAMTIFLAVGSLCCPGQENVNSPAATEFVRYERIPVSYFNGLPSIEIPVYTVETKDLYLPISLSYHASGIKVNQYPTAVGLGWALNAGGGITRIVNGIPDETCAKDMTDLTGSNTPRDPGYYFSSAIFMNDNWNKEEGFNTIYTNNYLDTEPDEFVINAYGLSGSIYFYRDQDKLKGARQQKVRPLLFSLISANQIDRTLRTLISSLLIGLSCLMARLNGT